MHYFKPGFWQKLVYGLLALLQFLILAGLVLYLSSSLLAQSYQLVIIAVIAIFVLEVITIIYILNSDSPNVYKQTWMAIVAILPLFGMVLYVIFANKQTSRWNRKKYHRYSKPITRNPSKAEYKASLLEDCPVAYPLSEYIAKCSGGGISQKTATTYFPSIEECFPYILEELRKARHYIFVEFFIVERGVFFDPILEILLQKAKEGVDVRIIYDDVGSMKAVRSDFAKKLQDQGIKCHVFAPFRGLIDVRVNNRDHRKMIVVDGHTCFTGGFNLADEYINAVNRFGHWKDNAIMVRGEAVSNYTYLFLSNYVASFAPGESIDQNYYSASRFIDEVGGYPESDGYVQAYGDIPYDKEAIGENVYLRLIHAARKTLYITTPYLIIDEEMENALCSSAKSGVKVVILTPKVPDKKTVFNVTRSFYGNLIKAGIHVYEYAPGFVHEKMFVVDSSLAAVGTINLDYRSLYLHMENGTLLVNTSCIAKMKEDFEETIKVSKQVSFQEWERWHRRNLTYWAMLRIITPFL